MARDDYTPEDADAALRWSVEQNIEPADVERDCQRLGIARTDIMRMLIDYMRHERVGGAS